MARGAKSKFSELEQKALCDALIIETEMYQNSEIDFLTTNVELAEMFNVERRTIRRYIRLFEENYPDLYKYRISIIRIQENKKKWRDNRETITKNMKKFYQSYEGKKRREEISINSKAYSSRPEVIKRNSENMKRLNSNPEFRKKREKSISKSSRENMKRLNSNPEFREKVNNISSKRMKKLHQNEKFRKDLKKRSKEWAIKLNSLQRKKGYFIENRFYASSQQEGAVALMLENYIPQYQVIEGKTFQVRDKEINNGGIDFLVYDEFLEWHPLILSPKTKTSNRGDIPSKKESESYKKVLTKLIPEEKKRIRRRI